MKTNQDGGSYTAKKPGAAAKELKKNEDGAAKMGYDQNFGAARVSPSKMGDEKASELMQGAAKYYDGAGMYMNGAPKYEGAGKYNGPMDIGHGKDPGHTHGDKVTGSVDFKVSDTEGAKLTDTRTSTSSQPSSTSSSANTNIVDKGESAFYNNLISSKKNMSEMKNLNIDPSDKKAVLDYGNKLHASRQSSNSGTSTTTTSQSSTQSNPDNVQAIESEGRYQLSKIIGQDNLSRHRNEMEAKRDSVSAANKRIDRLLNFNPSRDTKTMSAIKVQGGIAGNAAANQTRQESNIPTVNFVNQMKSQNTQPRDTSTKPSGSGGIYTGQGFGELKDPDAEGGVVKYLAKDYGRGNPILQTYKRSGSLYTDLDEFQGSPKMPKGPMKYGMKK